MQSAALRAARERQSTMAVAAYWVALLINAGTLGRGKGSRPLQPKDLLPGSRPPQQNKPLTEAQKRRASVKIEREVLWWAENDADFAREQAKRIETARARLREWGAPEKPLR